MSLGLTVLLIWLAAPAVVFAALVAFYPPFIRWRIARRKAAVGSASRMPVDVRSRASRESLAPSRRFRAPGA